MEFAINERGQPVECGLVAVAPGLQQPAKVEMTQSASALQRMPPATSSDAWLRMPSCLRRSSTGMFDLVVLDVMLPKLDGFEVLRAAKARAF